MNEKPLNQKPKSPFLIEQHLISPLLCEEIINDMEFFQPDIDIDGIPIKSVRHSEGYEDIILARFKHAMQLRMEKTFDVKYEGTTDMVFEIYPQDCEGEPPHGENCNHLRGKWVMTKEDSFTGVLFLSDHNDKPPFESDYEVYGGNLEFPQHDFNFNPERGTMVIFPSGPHFINATRAIAASNLYQVRFHIVTKDIYMYNPENFPGDYTTWFLEYS
jgi:hypothetical protein